MSYEVEQQVPIPPCTRGGRSRQSRFPFAQMQPGDSFLVPREETTAKRLATNAACYAKKWTKGWKFCVRTLPEGIRCWRLS